MVRHSASNVDGSMPRIHLERQTDASSYFEGTPELSNEEMPFVRRSNDELDRLQRMFPGRHGTLNPRKQDFPIGIRPDGTVNR